VRKEARLGGISVVIEDPLAAIDKHMVAYMSGRWLDPDGLHARPTPTLQEGVSEDMACATREKDTVWQGPSHLGVAFAIAWGSGLIHRMRSVGASIESIDLRYAHSV
jgi:hypothetical protein